MPRLLWPSWRWMSDQRHALACHRDSVGVAELVRRQAAPDSRCDRENWPPLAW